MGMTIDNAIGLLERGSQYNYYDSAEDFCKAYDMAIEIMRKYQHITEIVEAWKADIDVDSCDCMEDIEGVLNGNVD